MNNKSTDKDTLSVLLKLATKWFKYVSFASQLLQNMYICDTISLRKTKK